MKDKQIMPRDTYRRIKSMSREEMSDFFYNFSQDIANDIVVDLDSMKSEIGRIKGIGTTRLDEIMKVIEKYFNKKEN